MIDIVLNGEKKSIPKELNIQEMIAFFDYHDSTFAVALNGTFVSLKNYHDTTVKNGDEIEILAPMVGG